MNNKHRILGSAVLAACTTQAQASLPVDAVLNFDPGIVECINCGTSYQVDTVKQGSYFGMDTNGSGSVTPNERTALVQGNAPIGGFKLETVQTASGSHTGAPDGTESTGIDQPWGFFGNTGLHFTTSKSTVLSDNGTGSATIDMSGWRVTWNAIPAINMGSGTWEGNSDGVGTLTCGNDCSEGDTYILDYSATVPAGDPSGFGNVKYNLHFTGTIGTFNAAPVTTALSTEVSSTSAVPAGTSVNLDITLNVTDADAADGLSSTNVDNTSMAITNPSANIATNCTPTSVANNGNGTVTFPACPDGTYTFDFSFADGFETSNTSTVTVVASSNPSPNAVPDTASVDGTTATTINVLANDTDNDIDPTSVTVVTNAGHGSTSVNATTGAITYTADVGFTGVDTFTYTVSDDIAQTSNVTTVTVTVNAFNTPATSATFSVGDTATSAGSTDGILTIEQIGVEDDDTNPEDRIAQSCIGGCFDFKLSGLANGGVGTIVLPLSTPVPEKADAGNTITYRKLIGGVWKTFDRSGGDTFQSAPGTVTSDGISCPDESSTEYRGLTAGDSCMLLSITDGGPNDDDGLANGTVVDPGGLAEITRVYGTDGCSMSGTSRNANNHLDWWLVSAFIGLLGWFSVKRKQA